MQFTHRPPIITSALKTLTAAVASAVLVSSAAHAAGLGKLTVLSALGQPLRAEIELTAVSEEEASGLAARLASPEAFRVANIDFNPALLSLRFAVEQRNGRQYIKVSSTQPLNEPFVDMLVELSWTNGKLVREYTFLLDPAELRTTQPAQVAAAEPAPARARVAEQPAVPAEQPASVAPPAPPVPKPPVPRAAPVDRQAAAPEPKPQAPAIADYRVKRGDTLGGIASELKPAGISLDMMLVALYRANPDAFIGNNMNRLKAGQILSVPDAETIRGTGAGEARGVVIAHAADFNAYRNKLAGQVASSAPAKGAEAGQSATGRITARVEERATAANEAQDQLRLSKAAPANAGGRGAATTAEDVIAKEKALAEAQARVKELERNVSDLEKLMAVKSRAGSEAAKVAEAARPATPDAARPAPKAAQPAPVQAAAKPAQPAAKPARPAAEPSFADMLMDNINYVAAGAAILLLGLFGVAQRRKKKETGTPPAEPSLLGVPTEHTHSLFAETGGQSVDTNNSVFNSSFAPSASQLDTNEVDPVAEADVYIAYGRDAQAEEILKEALRTHPERHPVRLKLLEIYAARKDQRAFETQAAELYSQTRGRGDEWAQAAALGLSIDPLNPLYAGAPDGAPAAAAPTEQELGQQALLSQQLDDAYGVPAEPRAATDEDFRLDPASSLEPAAQPGPGTEQTGAAAEAPAAKAEDEHTLDFDLGGLSFEPVSTTEPIAMPGPAQGDASSADTVPDLEFDAQPVAAATPSTDEESAKPAEDSFDLAFDMNFDAPAAAQEPSASAAGDKTDDGLALDMSLDGPPSDIGMADLAKEFDLPDLPELPQAAGEKADNDLKDPLFDLDAMDFGQPAASPAAPAAGASGAQDDPFALPDLPSAPAAAGAPGFDLSDIDLDLPETGEARDYTALPEVEMAGGDGGMTAAHMEMETKLDLAIAYQEIGDKEGARELLDEVIRGGNSEQVSKASAMRDKLA